MPRRRQRTRFDKAPHPPVGHLLPRRRGRRKESCCGTGIFLAAILTALWSNNDTVTEIARATGAKVVELPNMCGGLTGAETWIGMMDLIHERLALGFKSQSEAR